MGGVDSAPVSPLLLARVPSPSGPDRLGIALVVLSAATWSLAGVWIALLPGVPVSSVVAGRLAISLLLVGPVALWKWRALGRPTAAAWGLAGLMIGYYGLAVAGFRLTTVAEGTLFINVSPLFAVAWALVQGEQVRPGEKWGTAFALVGVALIVLPGLVGGEAEGVERMLGNGLALAAAGAMAAYSIAFGRLKAAGRAPNPLLVTALTFGLGAAGTLALLAIRGENALAGLDAAPAWSALAGLGLVTTAIPTFAYSVASSRLAPLLTTTVRLLTPVFGAVAAWLVLDEVPSVWLAPGGALVLGGLLLSVRAKT